MTKEPKGTYTENNLYWCTNVLLVILLLDKATNSSTTIPVIYCHMNEQTKLQFLGNFMLANVIHCTPSGQLVSMNILRTRCYQMQLRVRSGSMNRGALVEKVNRAQ